MQILADALEILKRAETMIVEDECALLPLFHYNNFYLFDAHKVTGITGHPRTVQTPQIVEILGDGKGAEVPLRMEQRQPRDVGTRGAK